MPFLMNLWKVSGKNLTSIPATKLNEEKRLEQWIMEDPLIIGQDLLLVGHQIRTTYGGFIDILAMDSIGNLVIIELKRDKTPREVVAQILDYASWVRTLGITELQSISSKRLQNGLEDAFFQHFGVTIPESVNASHSMIIVASEMDDSSQRIVEYLAEEHGININTVFFSFFQSDNQELLGRAWLLNPSVVQERSRSKTQAPWSGYWFVNVGEGIHRNWEDNMRYGFLSAGQGVRYSRPLQQLSIGDKVFAYMKGIGYVGHGEVADNAVMIKDFIDTASSKSLLSMPLKAPKANENRDNPELSEWAVRIKWLKTYPRAEAKSFKGVFANQNIVCKLRHEETIAFLKKEFGAT